MRVEPLDAVRHFIADNQLLRHGDKVLVALSGGADSIALLHMLISLKEELSIGIYAAHFNHGIRGDEAHRDEDFSRQVCERWHIPFYCEHADVPVLAKENGESVELCGRRLRYDFLRCTAENLGNIKIATAHHQDDNAETVLWNLTRGTGIGGLAGIPVQRGNIIRPLLCLSREEIEMYCRENDLLYVTDSTNLNDDYTRNRLRHQIMPVLRELNPSVGESIAHTSFLMREADVYFNKISFEELNKAKTAFGYSCDRLLQADKAVLYYAIKCFLKKSGAPVDFRHITLIIKSMREGGAVDLGQGYTVSCAQGILRMVSPSAKKDDFCIPFSEFIEGSAVRFRICDGHLRSDREKCLKINNLLLHHCIPCDIITCNTFLRHRRAGDTFTDPRRGVTKTLKKLFNELKIPREKRDDIMLVADGSTVLWIEGIGTAAQAKADLTRDGEYIYLGDSSCIRTWKRF